MRTYVAPIGLVALAAALCGARPALAQDAPAAAPAAVDPATVAMPNLAFTPTPEMAENFDKYFYFHRPDTDFATAYADIQECDGYARGLTFRVDGGPTPYNVPATFAGAIGAGIGGVIGDVLADAIHGSAERRRQRRWIMRTCMRFKEYRAYGLPKALWEEFNFEEGNARIEEGRRQRLLQIQARAASGPLPRVAEFQP
jgi:hypothetical protein